MSDTQTDETNTVHLTPDTTYGKEVMCYFRKDELGNKRPTLTLTIPVPTKHGVLEILKAGGKQLDLLLDTVADVVYQQARQQVIDDPDFTAEKLKLEALTWEAIANLPKAERRGSGIPKETWEAFAKDYSATVMQHAGKTAEQAANAAKILVNKFAAVKSNKNVISKLVDNLNIWYSNTQNAEDFATVYEFLDGKATQLLSANDEALLENL